MAASWSVAASGQVRLRPELSIPPAELEAFVDGVVQQAMAHEHIAGASVSIVQNGSVILQKGYGFADLAERRQVDPETTLFRIGSITKTFTWLALQQAVRSGHIDLEGRVDQYLPESLRPLDGGFTAPIRVRHLMTHSAGFEDLMFGHLFETDSADVRSLNVYLQEERPRRVREPDHVHSYSNYGAALAGAILEQVRDRRWQDVIEADILRPLEMRHTTVREPYPPRDDLPEPMAAELERNLSKGYRWTGTAHAAQAFEYVSQIAPAGVISSSAGDMARYMLMLLNDRRLADVFAANSSTSPLMSPASAFPPSVGNWWGGFLQGRLPGGFTSIGHDGGSLLFFSSMALIPQLRLGVFVTTNTAGGDRLSGPLPSRIVERFYAPTHGPPRAASQALAASASTYNGFYLQTRRPYGGLGAFVFRLLARRVGVGSDGFVTMALTGPASRFVLGSQPDVLESVDPQSPQAVRIKFEGDRVTRIETPLMAYERVGFLRQPPVLLFTAAAVVLMSIGTLAGVRVRRETSDTRATRLAAAVRILAALAWLGAAVAFGIFAAAALADESTLLYDWPPASLLAFSAAALAGTVLATAMAALLPAICRDAAPRWTLPQKVGYATTTITFVWFGGLLGWWGALQPWNP
jgi:CubicO group peptidase (beta-lactamase class C family)